MRFLKLAFMFVLTFFLCGCMEQKAYVVFNSQPITTKTVQNPQTSFGIGQKIHYAILCEKGFKDKVLKVQVIKKDEKSEFGGFEPIMNREVEVGNSNFYIDYFVIHNKGFYLVQVFELKDLQTPIGYGNFWVK